MDISLLGYTSERGTAFFRTLLDRVSAIPGVRSATLAKSSPAVDWSDRLLVSPNGAPLTGAVLVNRNIVTPGYFDTLRIPLTAGRDFTRADDTRSRQVAIVSQALATRLWPGQNPIGRQVVTPIDGRPLPPPLEVIGVAADSRYRSVLDAPPLLLYSPDAESEQQDDDDGESGTPAQGSGSEAELAEDSHHLKGRGWSRSVNGGS